MQSNEDRKDEEIILSIKVSQVAVTMDLTTDGPAERMRKFLEELVPEIEKQEEETQKYKVWEHIHIIQLIFINNPIKQI